MNIFDPYGNYQDIQLNGGVFRDEGQCIIDDPLSLNLYAYCQNNPIMFTDPSGHEVTKDTPPTENDGYVAPKGGPVQGKDKSGNKGWVDKNGNVWVPVPDGSPSAHGGGHWDVQDKNGKGYVNKYPGGGEREGSGKRPNIPQPPKPNNDAIKAVGTGVAVAAGGYLLWTGVKWLAAALLAAPTGGGSLVVAAVTP